MGEELQKTIETILNGTKSKTGIAIKLLSQMVDTKFGEMETESKERHEEILKNMDCINLKFLSLEVVSFLSNHRTLLLVILASLLLLVGSGVDNIITTIVRL